MKSTQKTTGNAPVLAFKHPSDWKAWLEKNHAASSGIWLRIGKKDSGIVSVSYDEALEAALCYGWIDGQKKGYDEMSWLEKFAPRAARSIWSRINREKAQQLIKSGLMKPAGLKAVEQAKRNGRWNAAYDSQSSIDVPPDFEVELNRNTKAKSFFATLNSVNRYAILHRIQTANKPETRARRIQGFIEMLEKHEKIYP